MPPNIKEKLLTESEENLLFCVIFKIRTFVIVVICFMILFVSFLTTENKQFKYFNIYKIIL